jgi:cardiolipin synthase
VFADQVGWYGLWLAAGLTLITGLDYLVVGLRHSTAPAPSPGKGKPGARPATSP